MNMDVLTKVTKSTILEDTNLKNLWRDTRISSAQAMESNPNPKDFISEVLEAVTRDSNSFKSRCIVPSAGAIYPFYMGLLSLDAEKSYIHEYSNGRKQKRSLPHGMNDLNDYIHALSSKLIRPPKESTLLIAGVRPGQSMTKYGPRGYFYSILDAGHLIYTVDGLLRSFQKSPITVLHFNREKISKSLGLVDLGIEPIALIFLDFKESIKLEEVDPWPTLSTEERNNWAALQAMNILRQKDTRSPVLGRIRDKFEDLPLRAATPPERPSISNFIGRHSTAYFTPDDLTEATIKQLIESLDLEGKQTVAESDICLRMRIATNDNSQVDGKIISIVAGELTILTSKCFTPLEWSHACLKQKFVDNAAALIAIYVDGNDFFQDENLQRAHILAGEIISSMYLSSTKLGLGISAIGGFDDLACKSLFELSSNDEIIYIAAIGTEGLDNKKIDRQAISLSHPKST